MLKIFDISGNKNREFWFGHIVVLLATVVGVYLAASAGLRTAVDFELIKSDRDSYYMRTALMDELSDNIGMLETWSKEYRGGKANKFMGKPEDFSLDDFIWLTMQDNPSTFEIPGDILTGVRRFYRDASGTLRLMTSRKPAASEVDQLLKDIEILKSTVLKRLETDVDQLRKRVESHDIEV